MHVLGFRDREWTAAKKKKAVFSDWEIEQKILEGKFKYICRGAGECLVGAQSREATNLLLMFSTCTPLWQSSYHKLLRWYFTNNFEKRTLNWSFPTWWWFLFGCHWGKYFGWKITSRSRIFDHLTFYTTASCTCAILIYTREHVVYCYQSDNRIQLVSRQRP